MGCVAGEGLLLEYSQKEPAKCRGKMKAEFTMVTMGGSLLSSAFMGVFMNGKEYLGTFDRSLSFRSLMAVCLGIAICIFPMSFWVAVNELNLSHNIGETKLFSMYTNNGNLIHVP